MALSKRFSRRGHTEGISSSPRCASSWQTASPAGGPPPDAQDPARRGQRDEPRHALPPPRPPRLRGGHRRGRRAGPGHGALGGAGPRADGHEPSRARRLGRDPPAQSRGGDARHSRDRAHRARHVRRSREGHGRGLRRLRHEAGGPRAAGREDRGAPQGQGGSVTAKPSSLAHLRHELRTPLNHIIGYAELLLEDTPADGAAMTVDLRHLLDDARAVLSIVNERLAPGGKDAETVDVAALGRSVLEPVARIVAGTKRLGQAAESHGAAQMLPDLGRIAEAAERLTLLLSPAFPATDVAAPKADGGPDSGQSSSLGVLLVVDDDQGNRDLLSRRLVRDGHAALETLGRALSPPIELVLLDVMMPGIDGYEVLRRLKNDPAWRELPVLMISALDEVGSVVRCIELGADDYLPKPFDPVLLRARIGACLEKKRLRDREARQAQELAEWNRTLEQRVAEQVSQMERLGRLKRFFSPQLAELILAGGATDPLASHRVEVTVVFLDLRGFTSFAETADPEEVMGVLREYHAEMGRLILEHDGTLERFTGDGMMIFFNDPVPVHNAPERAVRMALAMRERALHLDAAWRKQGYDLGMGIGIAQGYATIGAIGFEGRWDYGAIGTVTNLAARLCGEASHTEILLSQRVAGAVEDLVTLKALGPLTLKGFARPVPAFRVLGPKTA